MRFLDLLEMSIQNLLKRKLRTILTILGVVIGTASIVVMLSLGIGLRNLTEKSFSESLSLTAIDVSSKSSGSEQANDKEAGFITDKTIEKLSGLKNVKFVSPILGTSVLLLQGTYIANVSIYGVSADYLKEIPVGEGQISLKKNDDLKYVIGNQVITYFENSKKKNSSYWQTGEIPDVDLMNKPIYTIFDINGYYSAINNDSSSEKKKIPKKYVIPTEALVKGGVMDYNAYAYDVYAEVEALKGQLRKVFGKNAIPNQPVNKKGKPYKYFVYDRAVVYADDMKNVNDLQKKIQDMGYQASSNKEYLDNSQQQTNMIQAVLGGIGAVSLFVAAIGIANTMMMSIYERTKEIGVMKVLGCDMGAIRNMFLIESGFIGFSGGLVGIVFSYIVSWVINHFVSASSMFGIGGNISQIPFWLVGVSIIFAVIVGMLAGFFPAIRAMKLSPLAAIRNE